MDGHELAKLIRLAGYTVALGSVGLGVAFFYIMTY